MAKRYLTTKLAWKIAYFTYQFKGIPIGDAARLTDNDMINNEVMFERIKTKSKVPSIPITESRQWIIDQFTPGTDDIHLLPILHKGRHDNEQSKKIRVAKMVNIINTGMKEIAKIQGIEMNLHTYVLHHTFSHKILEKYRIWHLKENMVIKVL